MAIPDFNQVINNINERLASAATDASAEELAYLGAAVEKIAGKANALDLLNSTESYKAELSVLTQQLISELTNKQTEYSNYTHAITEELEALKQSYQAQHENATSKFLMEVEDIAQSELTRFQGEINNIIAALKNMVLDTSSHSDPAYLYFLTHS